jgi:DNA processing protein
MGKDKLIPIPAVEESIRKYHCISELWNITPESLRGLGLTDNETKKFMDFRRSFDLSYFQKSLEKLAKENFGIVTYVDRDYPLLLKDNGKYHINPPVAFLIKGSMRNLTDGVAIVGTRECSFHGHMMARKLAKSIARAGYFVAAGLARGVDTEAHCGALEAPSGKTIAVLPWFNKIYPEENIKLAMDIAKNGALISEYYMPPFENSRSQSFAKAAFVIRNRIISGLCHCIILVESGVTGGTFRQASIAAEQGRQLFAVQPKSDNKEALEGFKKFVEMGAIPIESAKPVLQYLENSNFKCIKEQKIDYFSSYHF